MAPIARPSKGAGAPPLSKRKSKGDSSSASASSKMKGKQDCKGAAADTVNVRHYTLGFGSNYFYALGGTVGTCVSVPLPGAGVGDEGSIAAPSYQLGDVRTASSVGGGTDEASWSSGEPLAADGMGGRSRLTLQVLNPLPLINETPKISNARKTAGRASNVTPPPRSSAVGGGVGGMIGVSPSSSEQRGSFFGVGSPLRRGRMKGESTDKRKMQVGESGAASVASPEIGKGGEDAAIELPYGRSRPVIGTVACSATCTFYTTASSTNNDVSGGDIYQTGTLHGHTYTRPTPMPTRLPLKCVQLAAGRRHVLALMEQGAVVMSWGAGHFGQLGHGSEVTSCGRPKVIGRLLPQLIGGQVCHIAAGGLHSAAIVATASSSTDSKENLTSPTRTFTWGSNRKGQCGVEGGKCHTVPYPTRIVPIPHPDEPDREVRLVKLSLGRLHSVGLTETGEIYTWGSATMGRCGHGESQGGSSSGGGRGRQLIALPKRVETLKEVSITQIAAGDHHTLALTGGGRVFSWGCGSDGQLGHGHTMHLLSPRLVGDLDFVGIAEGVKSKMKMLRDLATTLDGVPKVPPKPEFRSAAEVGASEGARETAVRNGRGVSQRREAAIAEDGDSLDSLGKSAMNKGQNMGASGASDDGEGGGDSTPDTAAAAVPSGAQPLPMDQLEPQQPPKITSIYASGCYSAALSSSGDLYTWGYGDPSQLGHPFPHHPSHLPYVEPGPMSRTGPGNRIRDSRSFDSDLNVLLPRRVCCLRDIGLRVDNVGLGPGHAVLLCSTRDDQSGATEEKNGQEDRIGRTLYEIEQGRRNKGLNRLRQLGSRRTLRNGTGAGAGGPFGRLPDGEDSRAADSTRGERFEESMVRLSLAADADFAPVDDSIGGGGRQDEGTISDEAEEEKKAAGAPPVPSESRDQSPLLDASVPKSEEASFDGPATPTATGGHQKRKDRPPGHKSGSMKWMRRMAPSRASSTRKKEPAKGLDAGNGTGDAAGASTNAPLKMGRARKVLNAAFGGGEGK